MANLRSESLRRYKWVRSGFLLKEKQALAKCMSRTAVGHVLLTQLVL